MRQGAQLLLTLSAALLACTVAGGVGEHIPLLGRASRRERAGATLYPVNERVLHPAATATRLRGGGSSGIEENPEYESGYDDTSESESDGDASDPESSKDEFLPASDDDDGGTAAAKRRIMREHRLRGANIHLAKASKGSVNKRVRTFSQRNRFKLYTLLAVVAFRKDIFKVLRQCHRILPTKVNTVTGKRTLAIRWSTDVLKLVVVGLVFYHWYTASPPLGNGKKEEMNQNQNQTQTVEGPSSTKAFRFPLVLLLLLFIIPALRQHAMTVFFLALPSLPSILKLLNEENDQTTYLPPLEQHFAFEQLNERYYKDWVAWRKAFPTNSLVAKTKMGGDEALMEKLSVGGMRSLALSIANTHKLAGAINTSPPTNKYPHEYNNGTVVILDMTNLDTQVSKMSTIRDQVSFLVQLVQSGDPSLFSQEDGEQSAGQGGARTSVAANNVTAAVLSNGTTGEINTTHSKDQSSLLDANNVTVAVQKTNSTLSESIIDSNEELSSSPTIEVVVLLESPGGGVSQYGLAASHLQRLRATPDVKLTVCVDTVAASGGYMMACAASPGQLYCAPFAMVGSIGVIGTAINYQKALERWGARPYVFTGGKHKNSVGMFGDVTPKDVAARQEMVDRIHAVFREHVATGRREAFAAVAGGEGRLVARHADRVATGDVFLGTQALALGLVDRLVTSDEYLAERARQGARVLRLVGHAKPAPQGLSGLLALSARERAAAPPWRRTATRLCETVLAWVRAV